MRAGLEKQDLELGVVAQASLIAVHGRRRVRGHSELQARQPGLHSETLAPKTDKQANKQTKNNTKERKRDMVQMKKVDMWSEGESRARGTDCRLL